VIVDDKPKHVVGCDGNADRQAIINNRNSLMYGVSGRDVGS